MTNNTCTLAYRNIETRISSAGSSDIKGYLNKLLSHYKTTNNMKTVCIYHSIDLDGWMSAAIVKHWFNQRKESYINSPIFKDTNINFRTIDFIGYNYGQPIPDLSEYNRVIMCDISFPSNVMQELKDIKELIWIDHHISTIDELGGAIIGLRDTRYAACELTWKYFMSNPIDKFGEVEDQNPMPEIVRLLGMYDSFRHKGTDEEQKVLEFQYGARSVITNYEDAYNILKRCINDRLDVVIENILGNGRSVYKYLCAEAKQTYNGGFEIEIERKDINVSSNSSKPIYLKYKFICINKERFNPINFGIDYHKDGYDGYACFHYADGHWNFSLYNDNGLVDCSLIAKQYGGGGHKGAAGFRIKDINQIIK